MVRKLLVGIILAISLPALSQKGLLYEFKFDQSLASTQNSQATFVQQFPQWQYNRNAEANKAIMTTRTLSATLDGLPAGNTARTVSMWVNFNSFPSSTYLFSYGSATNNKAYGLSIEGSNTIKNYGWSNDISVTQSLSTSVWYHLVSTFANDTAKIYLNGKLILKQKVTGWDTDTSSRIARIGQLANGSISAISIDAVIDELKIYNTALSATEIMDMYDDVDKQNLANALISYYNFDDRLKNQKDSLTLSANNTLLYSAGKYGNAATFDKINYLYSTDYSNLMPDTADYTISLYKKDITAGATRYNTLFELFGSYFLRFTLGKFEFGYSYNGVDWVSKISSTNNLDANWKHVVMVHSAKNGTEQLYIDGNLLMTNNNNNKPIYKFNNIFAIGSGTSADGYFNTTKNYGGLIDEFYIFRKALNYSERAYIRDGKSLPAPTAPNALASIKYNELTIYPNPVINKINIRSEGAATKRIFDLHAKLITTFTDESTDLSFLKPGIYLIQSVESNGHTATARFVKQ